MTETNEPAEIVAEEIPSAHGKDAQGRVAYTPQQIVELLALLPGYDWEVAAPDTNAAHAKRIAMFLGEELCFCSELGWLRYNGAHWDIDDKDKTRACSLVATLSRYVQAEAAFLMQLGGTLARAGRDTEAAALAKAAQEHLKHARAVESRTFIEASLDLAANALRVPWDLFQPQAWRLGFKNGVWDAGDWRKPAPTDYMLSVSPVVFDPKTDRTEWNSVLTRMTGGDADLARTLQEMAGYCVSGASHLRLIAWAYGPKGTGKSTYSELLSTMLGSESASMEPDDFGDKTRERTGAKIWNKRLAVCGEAGQQRVSGETLKQLSGGDTLPVRLLYREAFDAKPRHVLLMASNDPPMMTAYDDALKARVMILPLEKSLSEPLPLKLTGGARIEAVRQMADSPLMLGFAAWVMDGLGAIHQTQEVHVADLVKRKTAEFWEETDPLTPFWETLDEAALFDGIAKADLRRIYEEWAEKEGVRRPLSPRHWTKACEMHGLEEFKKGRECTRCWRTKAQKTMPIADNADRADANSYKPHEREVNQQRGLPNIPSVVSATSANENPRPAQTGPKKPLTLQEMFDRARDRYPTLDVRMNGGGVCLFVEDRNVGYWKRDTGRFVLSGQISELVRVELVALGLVRAQEEQGEAK